MRPELEPLPRRLLALPIDPRGYPIPWFVATVDGVRDFRVADPDKMVRGLRDGLCWVCGTRRGKYATFLLGPMCTITRTAPEPPSHLDCASWSARNCPFLARPHMVRREDDLTDSLQGNSAGIPIKRNPGVIAVWTTRTFEVFRDHHGRPLVKVGDPDHVEWYASGRRATRAEIEASIASGSPLLAAECEREVESDRPLARAELARARDDAARWLPV